jgi:hypothetical protein
VAQIAVCATAFFLCLLLLLSCFFTGGGDNRGIRFGFGGSHLCLGAPEVHRDFGDFLGRIAELRVEAIESGLAGLVGLRNGLLEFLESLVAEDFLGRGVVVKATN